MKLEANSALILAKTPCSEKYRFSRFGPEKTKKWVFSQAYISGTKRTIKNLFWFSESSALSLRKMSLADFPYLHPFTLKIGAENRYRKKSQNRFFNFLELRWSDFLHIAQSVRGPLGLTLAKISCWLHFRFWIYAHFCKTDLKTVQKLDFSTPFCIFLKIGSTNFLGILDIVRG